MVKDLLHTVVFLLKQGDGIMTRADCNKEEVGEANIVSMDAGKHGTLRNGTEWNGMERNGMEQNGSNCCTIQTWMLDGQIICVNHIEQFIFGP